MSSDTYIGDKNVVGIAKWEENVIGIQNGIRIPAASCLLRFPKRNSRCGILTTYKLLFTLPLYPHGYLDEESVQVYRVVVPVRVVLPEDGAGRPPVQLLHLGLFGLPLLAQLLRPLLVPSPPGSLRIVRDNQTPVRGIIGLMLPKGCPTI